VVGIILSLGPHRSRSIGSAVDHVGIDKVMYFSVYFIFVFVAKVYEAVGLYIQHL
jgi:hypothetical protein